MEECPHGLDPSWCSLCKATLPSGVKRPRALPAQRPPRQASQPPRPVTRRPEDALAGLRKVLFHATAYQSWPSIEAGGLRTAAQLAGDRPLDKLRDRDVVLDGATLRDQRPLMRANIEQHLIGTDLPGWLELVNNRVFFFAQQKSLTTFLSHPEGQDLVVFDTRKLLRATIDRIEVLTDEMAAPEPWSHCPCRGPETFLPLPSYRGDPADVFEVAVVDGLPSVDGLVTRVVRHHPDKTTEVVVG